MKVILCGYHWTGCKALEILMKSHNEIFVYTHKAEAMVPDLRLYCEKTGIQYSLERISADNMPFIPDIICSVYYRSIIPSSVIEAAKGKIFNLHPSLLPRYRGCSSLTWAMINGEKECGYTYHYIDEGIDTGNIIIQKPVKIEEFDTQLTLYNRIMVLAMEDFEKAFNMVCSGFAGTKQVGNETYYSRGCPFNGLISENMDDDTVERFIRAMIYPPYPVAKYKGISISSFEDYKQIKKQ